jgi:hypothetical protein
MATITPATASGTTPPLLNPVASAPAGDEITVSASQELFIVFDNGHGSDITVTISGTAASITVNGKGAGSFTPTAKTVNVVAGTTRLFHIPRDEIAGFRNGSGRVPVTYASGNAALTLQAIVA